MIDWVPDVSASSDPIYLAIAKAIVSDVADGRLRPGDRLPAHRDLARALDVSIGTVTRAYVEAIRRGVIRGQTGRGTFVLARDVERPGLRPGANGEGGFIDLSVSYPIDAEGPDLAAGLRAIADRPDFGRLLHYHWPHMQPRYLDAGAQWVRRHGLVMEPDGVVITAGAQHALTTILSAFSRPGDLMFTDELTYPGLIAAAELRGLRVQGVTMDDEGMVPDALRASCRQRHGQFLYIMPTVQNPTSAVLSDERRAELAEIAAEHDLLIIEDDVQRLLVPDAGRPVAVFAPERTFYIASTTKCVAGGLRVAYVASPPFAREPLKHSVWATVGLAAPLTVELATQWILDGTADRIAERKRAEAGERQRIAGDMLQGYSFRSHPGSYNIWLSLPTGWTGAAFALEARRRGVGVTPSNAFVADDRKPPAAVRVCIGAAADREEMQRGLRLIANLVRCDERCPSALV